MTSPPAFMPMIQPNGRLFTAADLAVLPTHLPSGDIDYELDRGRVIVTAPHGCVHASIQALIATKLGIHGEAAGYGSAFTTVGVVLTRNPDTVLAPDAAFIGKAKLPVRESREGYLETIPDLVVEIRSKNDTTAHFDGKVAAYLAAGVATVWIADPEARTIAAHRTAADQPLVYHESDTLAIDELIPDFRLKVADVFRKAVGA